MSCRNRCFSFSFTVLLFCLAPLLFSSPALAFGDGVQVTAQLRALYGLYERSNICVSGNNPVVLGHKLSYDKKLSRLVSSASCTVSSDQPNIRAYEVNQLHGLGQLAYRSQIGAATLRADIAMSYQSDLGFNLERYLGSYEDSFGRVTFGVDRTLMGELIETGYLPGGLGNIAGQAYVTEHDLASSREFGASFAPRRLLPDAFAARDARFTYESPSINSWRIGTMVSIGPDRQKVYSSQFPVTVALSTRYANAFGDDKNLSLSLALAGRVLIGGKHQNKTFWNGAAQAGLRFDVNKFRFGTGFTYELNGADAYTGDECTFIPYLRISDICRDRYAVHISSGYVFQNITLGGGVFVGIMPDSFRRDRTQLLVNLSDTPLTDKDFGTDTYIRFGVGATVALMDGLSLVFDSVYTIDNIADESDDKGVNDSNYFIIRFGVEFGF